MMTCSHTVDALPRVVFNELLMYVGTFRNCSSIENIRKVILHFYEGPCVIGQAIIFLPGSFYLLHSFLFSSPNLSGRRLDVYHTLTHGVALVYGRPM